MLQVLCPELEFGVVGDVSPCYVSLDEEFEDVDSESEYRLNNSEALHAVRWRSGVSPGPPAVKVRVLWGPWWVVRKRERGVCGVGALFSLRSLSLFPGGFECGRCC